MNDTSLDRFLKFVGAFTVSYVVINAITTLNAITALIPFNRPRVVFMPSPCADRERDRQPTVSVDTPTAADDHG